MYSIVVDFGGTFIKIGLMKQGRIISFHRTESFSERGLVPRLKLVEKSIKVLLKGKNISIKECNGLGIAIPGIVDFYEKRVLDTNAKYDDAKNFSFEKWANKTFELPIFIENDARAALKGEVAYGVAKEQTDAVIMIFGTGIGTAAYLDSRLLRGKHHQAGCLGGHITTKYDGFLCTCGNIGCVEAQTANWALPLIAKERKGYSESLLADQSVIDYQSIIECAQREDKFSSLLLDELIEHWGTAIVNLIHAYDPETIILSGGLMKSKDLLLPKMKETVYKRAWTPWGKLKFVVAKDPDVSVLLGLSALVSENVKEGGNINDQI